MLLFFFSCPSNLLQVNFTFANEMRISIPASQRPSGLTGKPRMGRLLPQTRVKKVLGPMDRGGSVGYVRRDRQSFLQFSIDYTILINVRVRSSWIEKKKKNYPNKKIALFIRANVVKCCISKSEEIMAHWSLTCIRARFLITDNYKARAENPNRSDPLNGIAFTSTSDRSLI